MQLDLGIHKWAWLSAAALSASAQATVVWDEAVNGDLSNSGLTPNVVALSPGFNDVRGTTGRLVAGGTVDRDYFTIAVPAGYFLNSITLLPGSSGLGPLGTSFLGLQAGPQVTVSTSASTASGLLGWRHYGAADVGMDLLPLMAVPNNGSSGFSVPLAAGSYSFWVQETGVGSAPYGFGLEVSAVPEPTSAWMLGLGIAALIGWRRWQH
jgi:hypothetical protein